MPKITSAPAAPVSLRLPPNQLERVRIYAKNSGLTLSAYLARAVTDYLDRNIDHAVEKPTPTKPERFRFPNPVEDMYGPPAAHMWARFGLSASFPRKVPTLHRLSDGTPLDFEEADAMHREFNWMCGSVTLLKDPDFLPRQRHPQDTAWLDWWEHEFTESNQPELVERVYAIRDHLDTLPALRS